MEEEDECNYPWDDGYQDPPDDGGWDEHFGEDLNER